MSAPISIPAEVAARLRENIRAYLADDPVDDTEFADAIDRLIAIENDLGSLLDVVTD